MMTNKQFRDFLCARYNVTPIALKKDAMVSLSPFPCVTELGADTQGSSSHVIMNCVTSSFNLQDELYPLAVYEANPY